jgi:NAD(P)-dependent dehydrogenase (short-subunit alcohol dehydrogenase family)
MSRAALPAMIAAGGGSIIHIASQLGRVAARARAAYCTSKAAIIQLARAMAVDHADQNIRVNALSPGAIETRRLLLRYGDMATAQREAGPKHLLNRLGQPEEVARAALFLASDRKFYDRRRYVGRRRLHGDLIFPAIDRASASGRGLLTPSRVDRVCARHRHQPCERSRQCAD